MLGPQFSTNPALLYNVTPQEDSSLQNMEHFSPVLENKEWPPRPRDYRLM
jgi:hypothetical protein